MSCAAGLLKFPSFMNSITLTNLLPRVFHGMEHQPPVCDSQIWLREVTFTRGCRVCLSAESGGGKSSLLSFICGERDDYTGTIEFDNRDIRTLTPSRRVEIRRRAIALLPQDMRLFGELTAVENIEVKNRLTSALSPEEIRAMLSRLGLEDRIDVPVSRMSVGQQQRVAIVRALAQPFDFILLDEPVSHLDSRNNLIAAEMIEERAAASGAGIITTSVGNPLMIKNAVTIKL